MQMKMYRLGRVFSSTVSHRIPTPIRGDFHFNGSMGSCFFSSFRFHFISFVRIDYLLYFAWFSPNYLRIFLIQLFEPKKTISFFSKSWRLATVFVYTFRWHGIWSFTFRLILWLTLWLTRDWILATNQRNNVVKTFGTLCDFIEKERRTRWRARH